MAISRDALTGVDLRAIARALGGDVFGRQVAAPGPAHSSKDRSLSIRLSPTASEGFLVHSHAGDPWKVCRDYVAERLGLESGRPSRPTRTIRTPPPQSDLASIRSNDALKIWSEGGDPTGTPVETYLHSRCLELDALVAGDVLRWHPRLRAMLALFRNIATNEPQAISRTFLDHEARKIERKFLGPVGGAAIKLDEDTEVLTGLHVGEGVETVLAARQIGLRPAWAPGSASAIATLPVLSGVEVLNFIREHDDANARAAETCGRRWVDAGRAVFNIWPTTGKDLNDTIRESAT